MRIGGNSYDLQELAGAFGDLGTLIPFLVGYITVNKIDPCGVLLAFGFFKIFVGLYFKTPVPIQPMKAIGTAAITHAGTISAGAIWASGLFTGVFWLVMGVTGMVGWIARITSRPVVQGIVLGLGLGFVLEGVKMMAADPLLAGVAAVLTFVLLSSDRIPAMLVLLGLGAAVAIVRVPGLLGELSPMSFHVRLPEMALTKIGWQDLAVGIMLLGLPQVALTLGNAIIAYIGRIDPATMNWGYNVHEKTIDVTAVAREVRQGKGLRAVLDSLEPPFAPYARAKKALAAYKILAGASDPEPVPELAKGQTKVEPGKAWVGVPQLAARLRVLGDLPAGVSTPGTTDSPALAAAVKSFQNRHVMEADGVIGVATIKALNVTLAQRVRQIELAMERMRWLPELSKNPNIFVNVPLFRLWTDPATGAEPLVPPPRVRSSRRAGRRPG